MGEVFSDEDYDRLVDAIVASKEVGDADFGLGQLPQIEAGDPPVTLVSIAHPEHLNALASDKPLTFEATGLTIIYGDNASGKSGYARLLKRIARSRHQENVLSDVFHDTALDEPKADLSVSIGESELSFTWPESTPAELQRMLFYDAACGMAYLSKESDFPYRPSAIFVMDGLIDACVAITARIDAKLEENTNSAKTMPEVDEEVEETAVGKFLEQLTGDSSVELLDKILQGIDESSTEAITLLKDEEARLRIADTTKERKSLTRQAVKIESLRIHIDGLQKVAGHDAVATLQQEREHLKALEKKADFLATSFESEPLPGVGLSPWKKMWESARHFSEEHAYRGKVSPVVGEDARCVLCQQELVNEARERLVRFESFVQDDVQKKLSAACELWDERVESLANLSTTPEAAEANLNDLEADHAELVGETQAILAEFEAIRIAIVDAVSSDADIPQKSITSARISSRLKADAATVLTAAESLSDPEKTEERLVVVTMKRKTLELLRDVKDQRDLVTDEIRRLRERKALESVKIAAATGPITKKILDFSEEQITQVVRDTFSCESKGLLLERVTIAKTRGERGMVLHQPELVGARQDIKLPSVLSEGEQTALGLAACFTESNLDASKSALILDDPVSSLDHIRRGRVANRLSELAQARQVIVFTHDVSFVLDLKRAAKGLGVPVGERLVTKGLGGERKPGTCRSKHPWKAKDVSERLGELTSELSRIKRDREDWDDDAYEKEVAIWAGSLSETLERILGQEVVGSILAEGGLEVRPRMLKILVKFSEDDDREYQASYSRVSLWAKRHDKSGMANYVAPEPEALEEELNSVNEWFKRIKRYKE